MVTKRRLALRHSDGRYLSWSPNNYPLTPHEDEARRFYKAEEIAHFLSDSHYKPDNPEEYEIVTLKITYELEVSDSEPLSEDSRSPQSCRGIQ